jgi:Na+/H+ antiporter NhaD/arsenite permease-like protein
LTFLYAARGLGHGAEVAGVSQALLAAISCGSVFMGANSYIGNGPNFMVKAIVEENGIEMPTFLGYMMYSGAILLPTFVVVTFVFFR